MKLGEKQVLTVVKIVDLVCIWEMMKNVYFFRKAGTGRN